MEPKWLTIAKELQSLAQDGLAYSTNKFDIERFKRIREISVEIMSEYTNMEFEKIIDLFANEKGYQTPKIEIRAAIIHENKILLAKENTDGKWTMPGGWAEPGYSLAENLIKEAKEESGADVTPIRIIAVYDRQRSNKPPTAYPIYKVVVACRYNGGTYKPNLETADARFFGPDELPELSTPRNSEEQIRFCFEVVKKDMHEAYFD